MLILGIDDAGRGPVIGPMAMAGCLLNDEVEKELKKLGVKDSKQLTQKRREMLAEKIKEKAEIFEVVLIPPSEIDGESENNRIKLNEVEAIAAAKIINKVNKGFGKIKVVVDCPSVSIAKWTDYLKAKIDNLSNLEISCEHKADINHVAVSAASILAKCARESEMDKLKKEHGEKIGSGYSSDPLTRKFVENHVHTHKDKGIFRKSWLTWKKASATLSQKKLGDF
ncbi:ribonuclease HII [Candidatus Pacearchaeota archaeon]|nr:ribonuclease HII [Candidatus Pacearchaeota archaeon]